MNEPIGNTQLRISIDLSAYNSELKKAQDAIAAINPKLTSINHPSIAALSGMKISEAQKRRLEASELNRLRRENGLIDDSDRLLSFLGENDQAFAKACQSMLDIEYLFLRGWPMNRLLSAIEWVGESIHGSPYALTFFQWYAASSLTFGLIALASSDVWSAIGLEFNGILAIALCILVAGDRT